MIRAITLDLDDTLWAVAPAIQRAEQAVDDYLARHCPQTRARFPVAAMRALRERIAAEHPQLAHDFTTQRLLCLRHALEESGEDLAHAEGAFEAFFDARNTVDLYADVAEGLPQLAGRYPLAALTNGNADLARIGLAAHFRFTLGAREHGAAKPDPSIFHAACERLGIEPSAVLHVGDDPQLDVEGARRAGLRACWINRVGARWPDDLAPPDLVARDLPELISQLN
ncbi:HAD family hydrolase [Pseudomarimonas salicorniae]|uniref:HAD-IA family hydrolase n=1 Tax=Pseudomarimonas salicorniae TaxID=2933270 RepID=A0ABT0GLT3_9GAMM|nr:HAD-IA family hydrolase [Lysobacter sp. CAU 1642]MCK7595507.1 HAD-IA family hydrolase [Lysobacter sp. CAU 1642]